MRVGIFGGSFDPVHCGHLELGRCCRDQAQLDRIWFVPAAHQPFKPDGPFAANADRLTMLNLAIEGEKGFEISTLELDRGGMSYTVDTLLTLSAMAVSVLLLAMAVKQLPLGTAYAVWTGIRAVGTVLMGIWLFNEPATLARVLCLLLIIGGILGLKLIG